MCGNNKSFLKQFSKRLKLLRQAKYKSLNEFAFDSPVLSSATISRIENAGVDFKFTTLIKIASALKMTPSELLEGIDFDYDEFEQ